MTAPEDNPPMTPPSRPRNLVIHGVELKLDAMRQSHPGGVTPSTFGIEPASPGATRLEGVRVTRNAKLTRPAEQYQGEAERMIDEWARLAVAAIQRARDATSGPRLVSELEEAQHAVGEALRWSKP